MARAKSPPQRALSPAAAGEGPKRSGGPERRKNLGVSEANGREEAERIGAASRLARWGDPGGGEIFSKRGLEAGAAGLSLRETSGEWSLTRARKEMYGVFTPAFSSART
jgi:hypothetical protein